MIKLIGEPTGTDGPMIVLQISEVRYHRVKSGLRATPFDSQAYRVSKRQHVNDQSASKHARSPHALSSTTINHSKLARPARPLRPMSLRLHPAKKGCPKHLHPVPSHPQIAA